MAKLNLLSHLSKVIEPENELKRVYISFLNLIEDHSQINLVEDTKDISDKIKPNKNLEFSINT